MAEARLIRVKVGEDGAFGVLQAQNQMWLTVERTYENGAVKIPEGTWPCRKRMFNRGGYMTFEILVPGHTALLFHRANIETDLDGCIGLGERFGKLGAKTAVLGSDAAFVRFWMVMQDFDGFDLEVKNA